MTDEKDKLVNDFQQVEKIVKHTLIQIVHVFVQYQL